MGVPTAEKISFLAPFKARNDTAAQGFEAPYIRWVAPRVICENTRQKARRWTSGAAGGGGSSEGAAAVVALAVGLSGHPPEVDAPGDELLGPSWRTDPTHGTWCSRCWTLPTAPC